jgi:actin related protein 2/3 complex subunit 3
MSCQVNHSSFTEWSGPVSCGCALLPLKTKVKGPAAPCPADQTDVIDESLLFFRANVLFRNFQPQSPADLTLCYLTVFIGEVLRAFTKYKTKDEARKAITSVSMNTSFAVPGEKSFVLPGFFTTPASRSEGDAWRNYFRQAREETVNRLLELAYANPPNLTTTTPNTPSPSDAPQNKCYTTPAYCTSNSLMCDANRFAPLLRSSRLTRPCHRLPVL